MKTGRGDAAAATRTYERDRRALQVLPLGDLGVRAGAKRFFNVNGHGKNGALDQKKDAEKLETLFAPFAPYRSLAAFYMWRVADTKAFNHDAA